MQIDGTAGWTTTGNHIIAILQAKAHRCSHSHVGAGQVVAMDLNRERIGSCHKLSKNVDLSRSHTIGFLCEFQGISNLHKSWFVRPTAGTAYNDRPDGSQNLVSPSTARRTKCSRRSDIQPVSRGKPTRGWITKP